MPMGKPKLLQINTVADSHNSVGGIMSLISEYASAHGWDSQIAAGRGDLTRVDYCIGGLASVMTHVAASRLTDCEGWFSRRATEKFLREVDRWSPDVVHLHNLHGHYLHLPTLFRWLGERSMAVVLTFHDLWWLTGHCAFYSHLDCQPDGCRNCRHYQNEYPVSLLCRSGRNFERKRELLASVDRLVSVAPSRQTMAELAKAGVGGERVMIQHGIDLAQFDGARSAERAGVLAVAARWESRKNLAAINRLAESGLCREPITVVGHLMGQTLHENIHYLPVVDTAEEMAKIYSSAKVLIIPSISETFGLTAVEALASGTPVIANAESAVADIITSRAGRTVDMRDPRVIADAIDDIVAHYGDFDPKGAAGFFNADRMSAEYLHLYESLMER